MEVHKVYNLIPYKYSSTIIVVVGEDVMLFRKQLEEIGGVYSEIIADAPGGIGFVFKMEKKDIVKQLVIQINKGSIQTCEKFNRTIPTLQEFVELSNRVIELENKYAQLLKLLQK